MWYCKRETAAVVVIGAAAVTVSRERSRAVTPLRKCLSSAG
jgi:hypothetical protein